MCWHACAGPLSCTGCLQEVRRLEKLRAKRAFEATLPSIDDVERLPERQAMIEAWEVQEWIEREEEIKGVQEERLALLAQALQVGGHGCSQKALDAISLPGGLCDGVNVRMSPIKRASVGLQNNLELLASAQQVSIWGVSLTLPQISVQSEAARVAMS